MIVSFTPNNLRIVSGKAAITLRSDEPITVGDADADDPATAETTSDGQYSVRLSKRQTEAFSRLDDDAIIAAWAAGTLTLPNAVKGPGVKRGDNLADFLASRNASVGEQPANADEPAGATETAPEPDPAVKEGK